MAGSVNKVIIIGNLGKDPETRSMNNGGEVVSFSLATSESWNDKQSGERRDKTEWHNVVMWRSLAELAEKYVRKGRLLYIEGKIRTRTYGEENAKKYFTEIIADTMTFLGSRVDDNKSGEQTPEPTSELPVDNLPF